MKYIFKKIIIFVVCFLFLSQGSCVSNASDASKISITVIEKSGKDLKDYQVLISLDENNFSFESDKNSLSFTDENNAKLNYWIEEWDSSAKKAKIWVKIPELKANETKTIYMDLNGNDLPNGENTFEFFDDFNGQNYEDKWVKFINDSEQHKNDCENLDVKEINGELTISGLKNRNNWCYEGIKSKDVFFDFKFGAMYKDKSSCWNYGDKWFNKTGIGSSFDKVTGFFRDEYSWAFTSEGDKEQIDMPFNNDWHKIEITKNSSQVLQKIDDRYAKTYSLQNYSKGNIYFFGSAAEIGSGCPGAAVSLDWVYVSKHMNPEPEVILGKDISISDSSLSVSNQGEGYMVKGKISSTFNEDLENVTVSVYDKDPKDSSAQELARTALDKINTLKDTDFEINVIGSKNRINELFISVDPDNKIAESNKSNNIAKKKIPANVVETISPFLITLAVFLFIFIILAIVYYSYKTAKKNIGVQEPILQIKTCLKCGMVLDKNQSKCPVCGMGVFKL